MYKIKNSTPRKNELNSVGSLAGKHDYAISAIRFVSMLMIIACHFMQYYEMELAWWFNVGVQVFFTMSGFLYGKKRIDKPLEFFYRQFKKILIPYWSIIIIVSIIHKLCFPGVFSWGKAISALFCIGRITGMEHLWFVQYILICYLLLPYLLYLREAIDALISEYKLLSIVLLCTAIQFVGFTFNGYGMVPNRISCFVCGVMLATLEKRDFDVARIIVCLAAVAFNAVKIYGTYIVRIENNLIFDLFTKYAHGFLGVSIFLVLYGVFRSVKGNAVLRFSDRYSYYIYLVHQIFILGPMSLMTLVSDRVVNMAIICSCILVAGYCLEKETLFINSTINHVEKSLKRR